MNLAVGDKNHHDKSVGGGGGSQFFPLQGASSGNLLGAFYLQFPMGLKETGLGENLKHISLRRRKFL